MKLSLTDVSCGARDDRQLLSTPRRACTRRRSTRSRPTPSCDRHHRRQRRELHRGRTSSARRRRHGQSCSDDREAAGRRRGLAALPAKMATTLQAIKQAAPKARLVVLPYLRVCRRPRRRARRACRSARRPALPRRLRPAAAHRDQAGAAAAKVDFVDSYAPKGHDACAAAEPPRVRSPPPPR